MASGQLATRPHWLLLWPRSFGDNIVATSVFFYRSLTDPAKIKLADPHRSPRFFRLADPLTDPQKNVSTADPSQIPRKNLQIPRRSREKTCRSLADPRKILIFPQIPSQIPQILNMQIPPQIPRRQKMRDLGICKKKHCINSDI